MTRAAPTDDRRSATASTHRPTADELVAHAEAMVPTLVARQAETEERTYYAADTHEELRRHGFYRLLVPRRFGGLELGVATFLRVVTTLARGCPSTAWMYCLGAAHALPAASLFGERAQAELFRDGDFICPATIAPGGTAERDAEGRWLISGTWPYCSGSPYATHVMAHALAAGEDGGPPVPVLFVAPRDQWRRLDDWAGQLGLRGSGSHSVVLERAVVAADLALPGVHLSQTEVSGGTPGRDLHGNPEYGGAPLSFMNLEIAALVVGIALGAIEVYEDLMRTRTTSVPPVVPRSEHPDYQFWYAEAAGMIETAQAALVGAAHQWHALAASGAAAVTREQDLRLAAVTRHVIHLCWHAVERHLFPTAGTSAVRGGERLERIWRDLSTAHSHTGLSVLLPTVAMRELAGLRVGAAPRR